MKKILILGIVSIFLLTSFNGIINAGEQSTSDKIVTAYSFKSPVVSKVNINNTMYDSIIIDDAPSNGDPGEPLLPGKGAYILLPPNSRVSNIVVNHGEMVSLGSGYLVEPAGEPNLLSDTDNVKVPVPNAVIYSSTDRFPGELYFEVGTYRCRGYDILILKLNPVQYIPASGELFYYPELTVNVETIEDNDFSSLTRGLEKDNLDIVSKIDNPIAIESYAINGQCQSTPIDPYDMVIITKDSLKEGYEQLALAHNSIGVRTFIKTVEDIISNNDYWVTGKWGDANPDNPFIVTPITIDIYRFNDTQAKIRNFIRDAYTTLGIDYVLLGADNDVIPARSLSAWQDGYSIVPSDFYYAGLDDTWNRPENPCPEDKDISISDADVSGSGEGFLSEPVENNTDRIVGDSSMQWNCTNTNYGYGFCNLTFNTPMNIYGVHWLNFYIKSVKTEGSSYHIDKCILHSSDGSQISFGGYNLFGSNWGKRHIELPESNVFNWEAVDSLCFQIGYYNQFNIGDSIRIDGIYFSDLVDDYWGESGDDDLYAEVYIGRACTDNIIEVDNFVDKTIKYISTNPNYDYLKKVLMYGEALPFSGGPFMDELIDGSCKYGYTTLGIPSSDYKISKLYQQTMWSGDNIFKLLLIWQINNNVHIINHIGHSSYDYNMKIYNSDVDNLTNDKYCFIYSQGCMAGGFDDPEGYDCIAEHFTVKTSHGAFAGIWNTRFGLLPWNPNPDSGNTDSESQRYQREFWDAIFGENKEEIGRANQDSKEDNIWRINEKGMRYVCYELILFGDPSINLLNHFQNNQPNKPDTPSGPIEIETGVEYSYTTCTKDPDGHPVKYGWDWEGDFIINEWTDYYQSGETVTTLHNWLLPGPRWIRVKAMDVFGTVSEWSDPLQITLPVSYENSQAQSQNNQQSNPTQQQTQQSTQSSSQSSS